MTDYCNGSLISQLYVVLQQFSVDNVGYVTNPLISDDIGRLRRRASHGVFRTSDVILKLKVTIYVVIIMNNNNNT